MSRGFGRVERAALRMIEESDEMMNTFQIAAAVFDVPTVHNVVTLEHAQIVSTRRALRSLERAGVIVRLFRGRFNRTYWGNHRVAERYASRLRTLNQSMRGAA